MLEWVEKKRKKERKNSLLVCWVKFVDGDQFIIIVFFVLVREHTSHYNDHMEVE
jgi:hypothetical protein